MRFRGNQPRTMHFGKVKSGEHYSVSPMATLGPTVREFAQFPIWSAQRLRVRERTRLHETSRVRLREKTSRDRESRVRAFELDSGVIPTVKSEANKESES
jgi:hypothetical protein